MPYNKEVVLSSTLSMLAPSLIGESPSLIGERITVKGWVSAIRNFGGLVFIDITRNSVSIQTAWQVNPHVTIQSVVAVEGILSKRPKDMRTKSPNGEVEIIADRCIMLSRSNPMPFELSDKTSQGVKDKYRVLYLRTKHMQNIIRTKHEVDLFLHNYMSKLGFLGVRTPLMTGSTPEGATDYLAFSRKRNKDFNKIMDMKSIEDIKNSFKDIKYYALPQSPQIFKQLLMCGGFEKYYQIAPCFRDEDGRRDRNVGEFYQLDFEMAFVEEEEEILKLLDDIITATIEKFNPKPILRQTMTYSEAMERYGTDKPDLRRPIIEDFSLKLKDSDCNIFKDVIKNGGSIKSITVDVKHKDIILKEADRLQIQLGYIYKTNNAYKGTLAKVVDRDLVENEQIRFFSAFMGNKATKDLAKVSGILPVDNKVYSMVFVRDFPMFEFKDNKWHFEHNPFSKSVGDKPSTMRAIQYDVSLNGYELASGGLRETRLDVLKSNFELAGYAAEDIYKQFPHFKYFKYGVPPHGGAAIGLERLLMILLDLSTISDTSAFPINGSGRCTVTGAPYPLDFTSNNPYN